MKLFPGTAIGKFLKSNTLSSEYAFWGYLGDILKETSGFETIEKEMESYAGHIEYKVKKLKEGKRFPQAGHKVSTEVAMALVQGEEVYSYHYTRFSRAFYKISGTVFSIKKLGQTDRVLIGTFTVSIDGRDDFTLEFGKGAQYGIVIDQNGVAKSRKISILIIMVLNMLKKMPILMVFSNPVA